MSDEVLSGIDVSYANGSINWKSVASPPTGAHKVQFVFIKVTEGATIADPRAVENAFGAQDVGVAIGYYHFAYPQRRPGDAEGEAEAFMERLSILPVANLPLVLDLEKNPERMSKEEYTEWVEKFLCCFLKLPLLIYGSRYFLNEQLTSHFSTETQPLWLAQYTDELAPPALPSLWTDWLVWQYSESGRVCGISTAVDLNWAKPSLLSMV